MSAAEPRRIAHLWTPGGMFSVPIVGEWPNEIALGEWVFSPQMKADRTPLTLRGRLTGTLFLEYKTRRKLTCDDVEVYLAAPRAVAERIDGNGQYAAADREPEREDGGRARPAPQRRKREHFSGGRKRADVQAR